jgi:integrase
VKDASTEVNLTSNELCHTAASLLDDAGVPLDAIADQPGRVDTRMVTRTYRHRLGTPVVDAAVSTMPDLLE